jgi:hypothetical protein
MHAPASPPRHLEVRRPLGVALEEFLQPLSASLGHDARVPPPAWGAGSGLNEGDGLRGLGEGLGARLDLIAAVTAWFLARHGLALPSLCALVDVIVYEYSGKSTSPLKPGSLNCSLRHEGTRWIVWHVVTRPVVPSAVSYADVRLRCESRREECRQTSGIQVPNKPLELSFRACLKRSRAGCETPHHQVDHGNPDPRLSRAHRHQEYAKHIRALAVDAWGAPWLAPHIPELRISPKRRCTASLGRWAQTPNLSTASRSNDPT